MHAQTSIRAALASAVLVLACGRAWAADAPSPTAPVRFDAAPMFNDPAKAPIYAAATAGRRVVAVGDFGAIVFSDDGKTFRQANVPIRAPLTNVFFLDARRGWAVGHDGTILVTEDAGAAWRVQRAALGRDEVLMSVWFENAMHGLAVGQFGLALETRDGGRTWNKRVLAEGDAGERHFQQLVAAGGGLLFIAAEAGTLLRSEDAGEHWQAIQTSNKGSFWTGAALADGGLLMAGMRGHVYRSDDRGKTWAEVPSGTQQSLTGIVQHTDGSVRMVGLAGTSLRSTDGGRTFTAAARGDRAALTAIASGPWGDAVFTTLGLANGE